MSQRSQSSGLSPDVDAEAVLLELETVVDSPGFDGSARQIRLLRFLVGEVLAGRGAGLNAALIATRVFDRPAGFDSGEDSIVRVEMSKLRRALDRHYATRAPGAVRIELPRGSHAPLLTFLAPEDLRSTLRPASSPALEHDARLQTGEHEIVRRRPELVERDGDAGRNRTTVEADGPVLAVLPFAAVVAVSTASLPSPAGGAAPSLEQGGPGARSRAFARGLTDRLGELFGRCVGVAVVSRAATLEEAADRGARYVIEGTVRLVPGALRVTAKLHDIARGTQVWGNTYDRAGADEQLFAAEDEIARQMNVELLALPLGAVHAVEARERAGRPLRSAYEVALRFPRWLVTFDLQLEDEIRDACQHLLGEGEDQGVLLAALSLLHSFSLWTRHGASRERRTPLDLARLAVAAEPALVTARHALAWALLERGDGRGALAEAEAALGLGGAVILTGMVMALAGEWERGTALVRAHLAMLKHYPRSAHHVLALDAYRRGDYEAALAEAESIATPAIAFDPLDRALVLARLDRLPEARNAGRAFAAILPDDVRDPRGLAARLTTDQAVRDDIVQGLRLAGLR
jgi:TolB-like protein